MPHITYSGRESTSSAMNRVMRSFAAGNSMSPPVANSASGKTSVWETPARSASRSASPPGARAACGAKPASTGRLAVADAPTASDEAPAGAPTRERSPMSTPAPIATRTVAPCRNSAGPSTATAPPAVTNRVPASRTTVTSAATSPPRYRTSCAA